MPLITSGRPQRDPLTWENVAHKPRGPRFFDDPSVANAEGDVWTWDATNRWWRIQAAASYTAERTFTETTGAGTYTATVSIPAGYSVLDVLWINTALWTAATSATLDVGDDDDADGYYAAVDLKAAPAVVTGAGYGLNLHDDGGAYTDGKYAATAKTLTATVVTVGASGNAGRSRMLVLLARGANTVTAATKA